MARPSTHPILSPTPELPPVTDALMTPSPTTLISNSQEHDFANPFTQASVSARTLRDDANQIDPLQANGETHRVGNEPAPQTLSRIGEHLAGDDTRLSYASIPPPSATFPFRLNPAFPARRKSTAPNEIPRQTILKALASRPSLSGASFSKPMAGNNTTASSIQAENTALLGSSASAFPQSVLNASPAPSTPSLSPMMASLLKSPCFFHRRFEGIVDTQKVFDDADEEEEEDEYSHSRLMQTATSVREISKQLQRRPIKRAVRNVMIVTKARDNNLVYLTRDLAQWLLSTPRYGSDLGVTVYVDAKLRHSKRFNAAGLISQEPRFQHMLKFWTPDVCWTSPEKFDLVLTLGGDGTVLFTSWLFQRVVPPVLSFCLGSLGFLTAFEFDRFKEHLTRVMGDGGMRVNLRMRFTCTVWRADTSPGAEPDAAEEGEQFEVLNELVIDRGPSAYVSNLELYGDNELLTVVQADGCIFSTPTGSTAYSLSAGGSLIHPSIPAILLTPICPHTLSFRPMVLSDALSLRIAVPTKSRSSAYCSFDGKGRIELRQGDYVTLEASQYPFPTVMSSSNEWVESVQRALRWNVRGAVQKGWEEGNDGTEAEETWDIDTDPGPIGGTDSGIGPSEDGEAGSVSPMRRQMSLLSM